MSKSDFQNDHEANVTTLRARYHALQVASGMTAADFKAMCVNVLNNEDVTEEERTPKRWVLAAETVMRESADDHRDVGEQEYEADRAERESDICEGHGLSTDGPIGTVEYCDGSCKRTPRMTEHTEDTRATDGIRGRRVRVVRGRKVPLGTTGVVFWQGADRFDRTNYRIGFKSGGQTFWTSARNVETI